MIWCDAAIAAMIRLHEAASTSTDGRIRLHSRTRRRNVIAHCSDCMVTFRHATSGAAVGPRKWDSRLDNEMGAPSHLHDGPIGCRLASCARDLSSDVIDAHSQSNSRTRECRLTGRIEGIMNATDSVASACGAPCVRSAGFARRPRRPCTLGGSHELACSQVDTDENPSW